METVTAPQIYASFLQDFEPNINLVARGSLDTATLVRNVKGSIWSIAPDQAVFNVKTMDQVVSNSVAEPRFVALLIGAFALLAVVMAAAGVYSVVSYLVSQRTREIAVRVALGAQRGDVLWMVAGQTVAWSLCGLFLGAIGAVAVARMTRGMLPGAAPVDVAALAAVCAFFAVVAISAAYAPARRAVRLDPVTALRCE